MPKKETSKTIFLCKECSARSLQWSGQCIHCSAWNSLVEMEKPSSKNHQLNKNIIQKLLVLKMTKVVYRELIFFLKTIRYGELIILRQKFIMYQDIHRGILRFIFLRKIKFSPETPCFHLGVVEFLRAHINKCLIH